MRVVFGVSSSPFLLNATILHNLKSTHLNSQKQWKKISRLIYVDDIAYGADTEDLAYEMYWDSKSLLKEGGFNLRKFVMNAIEL